MNKFFKDVKEIQEDLRKLRALQQDTCEDCISRQAVLDDLEKSHMTSGVHNQCTWNECVDSMIRTVRSMPSVTQQKIGHWIDTGSGQECSECREIQYGYDSFRYFCANCGAKMEGGAE
ncbi:MAG TPA: hypothetical protein DHV77_01545 [Erysipelotrichaceae bacterium]|nr:hypothetical protein [Erysipelotrichaceae bacterium]